MRRGNLAALVHHVHVHGGTSRSELTEILGLNRSTIGALTADLVATGLLREQPADPAQRTSGRPSYVVAPESEQVQVVAVDLRVTHLTAARIGVGGAVLDRATSRSRPAGSSAATALRAVHSLVSRLLARMEPGQLCLGVGVSVPGLVRDDDGLVRQVPGLGWREVPLGEQLASRLRLPVSVGNDADLGALAEHTRGAGIGHDDMIYLSGHSGIGAGILINGRRLAGRQGFAGEVGHVVVNPAGLVCHCGSRGCWETEIGEDRLLKLAGRPTGGGTAAVHQVVVAARAGERRAGLALREVATRLGHGLASVVNAFNPEMVIIGGALGEVFGHDPSRVVAAVEERALPAAREGLRLELPGLGDDSSLSGAAELVFAAMVEDPLGAMAAAAAVEQGSPATAS